MFKFSDHLAFIGNILSFIPGERDWTDGNKKNTYIRKLSSKERRVYDIKREREREKERKRESKRQRAKRDREREIDR